MAVQQIDGAVPTAETAHMATAIYEQTIELLDWSFGAALATILLVVVLGISLAYGALVEGRTDAGLPR